MDGKDKRRMALCIKFACAAIDTHRTIFTEVERPEVCVARGIPHKVARGEYDLCETFTTETIRLDQWAFVSGKRGMGYRVWWAYYEPLDTVYYCNWRKVVKTITGWVTL